MKENKIPSAEELAGQLSDTLGYDDLVDPIRFTSLVAIEFAKIHCKAALAHALEESLWVANIEGVDYDDIADSILSAYPEELIK